MTEKNRVIAMGLVLLAIQALVGWSVFLSIAWMKENWGSLTGDNVPDWTHWALAYGLAIPLLAVAATVVVLAVLLWRDCRVGNWLLSIAIVEIVALSLFAASITCPAATIMYRMSGGADRPFGIYLTQYDAFKIVPKDSGEGQDLNLDLATVKLAEQPIISANDILGYDWNIHSLKLKSGVAKRLPKPSVFGQPFVFVAYGKRCYLGGLWTSASSVGTSLPVINVDEIANDTLIIRRGYPVPTKEIYDARDNACVNAQLIEMSKMKKVKPPPAL